MMKKYRPKAWLWWLALFFLLIGGALIYMFSLRLPEPTARTFMGLSMVATIVVVGLCLISASSDWWMRR